LAAKTAAPKDSYLADLTDASTAGQMDKLKAVHWVDLKAELRAESMEQTTAAKKAVQLAARKAAPTDE
jgi:hypothetical protein